MYVPRVTESADLTHLFLLFLDIRLGFSIGKIEEIFQMIDITSTARHSVPPRVPSTSTLPSVTIFPGTSTSTPSEERPATPLCSLGAPCHHVLKT